MAECKIANQKALNAQARAKILRNEVHGSQIEPTFCHNHVPESDISRMIDARMQCFEFRSGDTLAESISKRAKAR